METEYTRKLLNDLKELTESLSEKELKIRNVKLLERVIKRLGEFSEDCDVCKKYLSDLDQVFEMLKNKHGNIDKNDIKQYRKLLNKVISHLQNEHKLVTEGFYIGTYMSFGLSIGLIFGLIIFENISIGLSVGIAIGVAVGAMLDADAKKKGLTI